MPAWIRPQPHASGADSSRRLVPADEKVEQKNPGKQRAADEDGTRAVRSPRRVSGRRIG